MTPSSPTPQGEPPGRLTREERTALNRRQFIERRLREHWKPIMDLLAVHPHPTQMDLSDWRREHPTFPIRSLTYLRGEITKLKKLKSNGYDR